MSDRLDIVRLIDAKVTSTQRTVARSKQLAGAARGELRIHEDWIRQHNEGFEGDLRRQQHRMKRRERRENNKRFAKAALLFLPHLSLRLCSGLVLGLRKADDALLAGWAGLSRAAYGSGHSLAVLLTKGGTSIGSKAFSLVLVLAAALWLMLSWLAKKASAAARIIARAAKDGLSWLGPKVSSLRNWLFALVSLSLSGVASRMESSGQGLRSGTKGRSGLASRPRRTAKALETTRAPAADPSRLNEAILVRLRVEHDRLQARIHAMDRHYEQRASRLGHTQVREWVELRRLAVNAQRLFDAQQRQVLGPAALCASGASSSGNAGGESGPPRLHPLQAGHAIYEAPALLTGHRRT